MSVNSFGGRMAIREDKNGKAWHGLNGFSGEQSAIQTIETFSDGIPIFKKKETFFVSDDDQKFIPTGDFAILRLPVKDDDKTRVIGYCTKNYHIVQAEDIAKSFDEKVGQPIETLGFLSKGEKMFLTWEMPKSIFVGGIDEVKLFGTVLAGFDAKVAISLSLLSWRVVCENTFNIANNFVKYSKTGQKDKNGQSVVWIGRHNSPNILRDLSAWMGHVQSEAEKQVAMTEGFFNLLHSTPIDDKNVLKSLIEKIYPKPEELGSYPAELRKEKEEKLEKERAKADVDQQEIQKLFGGQGIAIDATGWGLFNCVSQYENHIRDSKKDTANSIVFGNRSKQMNNTFGILLDYATENKGV